jgi:2-polyprenyl-3-methyl-5-hydroxy-6-metoxy-1,4-benzoquinol methylase
MSTPRIEDGVVVGTGSNKYETKNPIARFALGQLTSSIAGLAAKTKAESILEIGCGEGHITKLLLNLPEASVRATDISNTLLQEARANVGENERVTFDTLNIYDINPAEMRSDLVVCCEVLEHLQEPAKGLKLLARASKHYTILSVPREPNFRILNFLRGQHFTHFGNAPGHVQHWSKRSFLKFLSSEFEICEVRALLPWTLVLAKPLEPSP